MPNTKIDAINGLLELAIPVSQVVDVGVQKATYELISCFPTIEHILFEPAKSFHIDIKTNYKNIKYKLFDCAISSSHGQLYQIETSINNDGVVTHSYISETDKTIDGVSIINSSSIEVKTLDDFADLFTYNYLLKIDVDGLDLEVLKGGENVISNASVVIIEATRYNYLERAEFLQKHDFQLVNIVDRCLYGAVMWQFDYIFVRKNILIEKPLPTPHKKFEWKLWKNVDRYDAQASFEQHEKQKVNTLCNIQNSQSTPEWLLNFISKQPTKLNKATCQTFLKALNSYALLETQKLKQLLDKNAPLREQIKYCLQCCETVKELQFCPF